MEENPTIKHSGAVQDASPIQQQQQLAENSGDSALSSSRAARAVEKNNKNHHPSSSSTAANRTKRRSFPEYLDLLMQFKAAQGHCLVPRTYETACGVKLGQWVCRVRHLQKTSAAAAAGAGGSSNNNKCAAGAAAAGSQPRLTREQMEALHAIGFTWRQSRRTGGRGLPFGEKVALLKQWHATHGHFRVPQNYKTEAGVPLGNFVAEQRREYNKLQRQQQRRGEEETTTTPQSTLTAERLEQLNAIGFDWNPVGSYWKENLELLQTYHAQHGHVHVPARLVVSQTKLGAWCERHRQAYRHRQEGLPTTLTPQRIQELNALGFDWRSSTRNNNNNNSKTKDSADDEGWNAYYQELVSYQKKHKSIRVPDKYVPPDKKKMKLGVWCKHQKQLYRDHQDGKPAFITEQRIAKLKAIGLLSDTTSNAKNKAPSKTQEKRRRMYEVEYVQGLEKRIQLLERLEDDHQRELESLRKHLSKYTDEF